MMVSGTVVQVSWRSFFGIGGYLGGLQERKGGRERIVCAVAVSLISRGLEMALQHCRHLPS